MAALDSSTPVTADQRTVNVVTTDDDDDAAGDDTSSGIDKVEDELKRAAEKVEAEFSKNEARMHRYPAIFRGLMSKYHHYFVPRCVAIGPYHHSAAAHLRQAEEMKRAAAYFTCEASGHSAEVVYARILSVAGDARRCYDHDAVAGIPQADFATMMFHDACFLLQYIIHRTAAAAAIAARRQSSSSLRCWFMANGESIHRDIFLLENQVPWLVLDALMSFVPTHVDVGEFISNLARSFEAQLSILDDTTTSASALVLNRSYKPAHLLDLLHHYQSGSSSDDVPENDIGTLILRRGIMSLPQIPQSTSAIDLAEIGIQLTNNRTAKFRDMGLQGKCLFFCELFLAPLVMDDQNACWLLNMVAFETSLGIWSKPYTTVRPYVSLIAMLMNREEDVHELRAKRILHGEFSDRRTLSFLKDLVDLNFITDEHTLLMADLEDYRLRRWMWISLHRFIYKNMKSIVTVLSIIGVLVGIFKTLFSISMKQH